MPRTSPLPHVFCFGERAGQFVERRLEPFVRDARPVERPNRLDACRASAPLQLLRGGRIEPLNVLLPAQREQDDAVNPGVGQARRQLAEQLNILDPSQDEDVAALQSESLELLNERRATSR